MASDKKSVVVDIYERIFEEIRHRYSASSIIKGAIDNEIIYKVFKNIDVKMLKKWKHLYNPNLKVLIPELSDIENETGVYFLVGRNGRHSLNNIYDIPPLRKYIKSTMGFDPMTEEGKKAIWEMLDKLAQKEHNLAVIGYGGAMINFLWDLFLLKTISEYPYPLFNKIVVFERENLSLTNLFRIGKFIILENYSSLFLDENGKLNKLNLIREEFSLAKEENFFLIEDYLTEDSDEMLQQLREKNYLMIGAPNFAARKMLEKDNFFFFGHANNELEIFYQPYVDDELTFESYGSIDIPVLISNIAAGTIAMVNIFGDINKEDLQNKDKSLFNPSESLFRIDYGEYLESQKK